MTWSRSVTAFEWFFFFLKHQSVLGDGLYFHQNYQNWSPWLSWFIRTAPAINSTVEHRERAGGQHKPNWPVLSGHPVVMQWMWPLALRNYSFHSSPGHGFGLTDFVYLNRLMPTSGVASVLKQKAIYWQSLIHRILLFDITQLRVIVFFQVHYMKINIIWDTVTRSGDKGGFYIHSEP